MSLNQRQTLWLARFAGVTVDGQATGDDLGLALDLDAQLIVARSCEEIEALAARKLHLDQMRRDVDALKGKLRDAFADDIELKGEDEETMKLIDADQTQAFDWREDFKKLDVEALNKEKRDEHGALIEESRANRMSEAKNALLLIEMRMTEIAFLRSRIDTDTGTIVQDQSEPLFDQVAIIKELYTPLVRGQFLPETFVEDEYSEVYQMISETNDIYIKELESVSENAERDGALALLKDTVTTMGSIAADSVDINMASKTMGATATDAQKAQVAFEKGCAKLVAATLTTSADIAVKIYDGDPEAAVKGALASMADSAGFIVTQATGSKEIGKFVKLSMSAAPHVVDLARAIEAKDGDKIAEKSIELISSGFSFGGVKADDELGRQLAIAKESVVVSLRAALAAKKADLLAAVERGDWGTFRTLLVTVTADASRAAFTLEFKTGTASKDVTVAEKSQAIAKALGEAAAALQNDPNVKAIEAAKAAEEAAQKHNAEEYLQQEQASFENALELLGQRETLEKGELKQISKLIADLKRDNAILKTATTVGGAGFAVAQQFLAPMAIGGTLVAFTATLAAAVNRAIAMRKWLESQEEALSTANPYLTSIQSFVKSQREQFTHKAIAAALLLLRVAAQITATAGTGTPVQGVATIIDKGLSIAASLEELTFKFHQEGELRKAWTITKRALDDPSNRKANLMARKQNPTLAKYSIAYGAVVAKDVIAVSAMNRIGLSRETLAQKDASVQNVKTYLEELYSDDIQVKRKYVPQKGWASSLPAPALTARSWMISIKLTIDGADLASGTDGDISRLFSQTAEALDRFSTERIRDEPNRAIFEDTRDRLKELYDALSEFQPTSRAGKPIVELEAHRDLYLNLIGDEAGEVMLMLST